MLQQEVGRTQIRLGLLLGLLGSASETSNNIEDYDAACFEDFANNSSQLLLYSHNKRNSIVSTTSESKGFFKKMDHSWPLFLYLCLSNTVDSKQMFHIKDC